MSVSSKEDQAATLPARYWQIELMLGLVAFFVGFNALLTITFLPSALQGWGDFRQLYTGGYMVRIGEGHSLYDYDAQVRYEQQLVPIPTHLPVNHLAYEHLLFAPLSKLSYEPAYLIFFAINIGLVALTIKLLGPSGQNLALRWIFFVPCMVGAFLPIWRALLQGQDSILLLALLAAAMFVLQEGRPFEAGLLAGAGLFKFQIVLPVAILFLLWKQWRFVEGFCVSALAAIGISVWMIGIRGVHQYVEMMAGMSVHLKSQADVARYATSPLVMLNLRGLITGVFGRAPHIWVQMLIAVSSIVVLVLTAKFRRFRNEGVSFRLRSGAAGTVNNVDVNSQFSLAVLAASLVSYHFIEHDASILIIPVVVALASLSAWRGAAAVLVVLGTLAGLSPQYGFLGAVPVLGLFVVELSRRGNNRAQEIEDRALNHA
jgi:hypothetical protein